MRPANTLAAPRSWLLVPERLDDTLTGRLALAFAASLFVAVCAHASFRLPFTPVPLTLGDMAVVLVGLALGPVTGFAAMVMYLAEGALGAPVFNPGGLGGVAQLLGPTGGYLCAYPLAAAASGKLVRSLPLRPFLAATTAALAATIIILTLGVTWLIAIVHLTPAHAFTIGALPFLPGQVVKILTSAGIVTTLQRWRQSR